MGVSRRERARGAVGYAMTGVVCAVLGALCVVICGYRFGVDDQAQYLVQVIGMWDAGLFGGDAYLRSFDSLGSVFWHGVALIADESSIGRVALALMLGVAAVNAVLLTGIGRVLLRQLGTDRGWIWAGGLLPTVLLVVPKELNWFGVVSLADMELTATVGVVPTALGAVLLWVKGKRWWSLAVSAAAVSVHAQTGGALLAAWWCAAVWCALRDRKGWVGVGVVGTLGAAGLCGGALIMGLGAERTAAVGAVGRDLYAELIDPTSTPLASWGAMLGVIGLGALAAIDLRERIAGSAVMRGFVVWWVASMVYPVCALVVHAAGVEHVLLWRLMTGRAFMLGQICAVVMVGVWCAAQMGAGGRRSFDGALVLATVAAWPFPLLGEVGGAVGLMGVGATIVGPGWLGVARGSVGVVREGAAGRAGMGLGVAGILLGAVAWVSVVRRDHAWTVRTDDPAWLDVQEWARANTGKGAVFVTPPYLTGWRIGSHRATFGELRDGGLLFYKDDAVVAWRERMAALGMGERAGFMVAPEEREAMREGYHRAISSGLDEKIDVAYVVREKGFGDGGVVVWGNEGFEVLRFRDDP